MIFKKWLENDGRTTLILTIISGAALILSLGGWLRNIILFDVAWISIILSGIPIVYGAVKAIITAHDIKADFLVSIALIASIITKEFFAAGEVALIMQIGSLLEDFTSNRAQRGIEKLIELKPQNARVKRDGKEIIIPAEDVKINDILIVLSGETIPVDGILTKGEASVDQSVMTGESIPVDKKISDKLIGGTVNAAGTFEMKAEKTCSDSSLQRMIKISEEADANKAPIVRTADKWATVMVIAALLAAAVTGIITHQIIRAVTVLVVFCPCAFVLATPTAVAAAIGNLTKYGILIRTGDALERLSKIDKIAFDKTGTLTYGKLEIISIKSFSDEFTEDDILRLSAEAEQYSEHPIGKAIVKKYKENGGILSEISERKVLTGVGVEAVINGRHLFIGKASSLQNLSERISSEVDKFRRLGATAVLLSCDEDIIGMVALSDTLRKETQPTIQKLNSLGISPVLLTGDNPETAAEIAKESGIKEVKANLMPDDKMKIINENSENKICMVGDGVNDALALRSAYASVAMGGIGSDIAVESSDVVLVSDEIKHLPYLFRITRKAMTKVKVNILISLTINIAAVVLSVLGILNPVTGALVHNCGSVLVVINAALILINKEK